MTWWAASWRLPARPSSSRCFEPCRFLPQPGIALQPDQTKDAVRRDQRCSRSNHCRYRPPACQSVPTGTLAPARHNFPGNKPAARLLSHAGQSAARARSGWRDRPASCTLSRAHSNTASESASAGGPNSVSISAMPSRLCSPAPASLADTAFCPLARIETVKPGAPGKSRIAARAAVDAPQHQRRLQRHRSKGIDGYPDMGRLVGRGRHHRHAGGKPAQRLAESAGIEGDVSVHGPSWNSARFTLG